MEEPTPFDLNQAIREWRLRLGKAIDRPADLDELESHLRDSVANPKVFRTDGDVLLWLSPALLTFTVTIAVYLRKEQRIRGKSLVQ